MNTITILRSLADKISSSDKFLAKDLLIDGQLVRGRMQLRQDKQAYDAVYTGVNQQQWLLSVPVSGWPLADKPQAQSKLDIDGIGYKVVDVLGTDPSINIIITRNF